MRDSNWVIVCSVCGYSSPADRAFCVSCRSRLGKDAGASSAAPDGLDRPALLTWLGRRPAAWFVAVIAVPLLGLWLVYVNVGPYRFLPPPSSGISSIPGLGEWSMSHRAPDRNSSTDGESFIPQGITRWEIQSGSGLFASPAIVSGKVYLPTGDGRVVALDADSGETQWAFVIDDAVKSTPAVAGGLVFVGLQDSRVVALNADTGELVWEFATGNPVLSSPVVYEGVLYVGSNDWRLYALDALTGNERWSFKADNVIRSDPAVHPPVLAFTDIKGKLYLLDLKTGKRRFDYQAVNGAEGGAVFDNDRLFLADLGGRIRSIDWSQREFPFEKTIAWIRFQLRHFGLTDSVGQQKGFVWFFLERDSGFSTTPVVSHGYVFAASRSGTLIALDREYGALAWRFRSAHPFEVSPSIWGEIMFIADGGGILYAIDAVTGRELWRLNTASPVISTPIVSGGTVYLTLRDGSLLALR